MISEDIDVFLDDFGVSVTAGAVSGVAILDMPGMEVLDGNAISTGYAITCRTDEFGTLRYGAIVEVDGVGYTVLDNLPISDGKFCKIQLERADADQVLTVVLDGDIF